MYCVSGFGFIQKLLKGANVMSIKSRKGFTLIEILLVVVIIVILVSMTAPKFSGQGKKARVAAARADIEGNVSTALDMYELDIGQYPSTSQGLGALLEKPTISPVPENWSGPYLKKKKLPTDPWGREYRYVAPGVNNSDSFDLSSFGQDAIKSSDDIRNW